MKKFIVILLVLLQITWGFGLEEVIFTSKKVTIYPSFINLLKIVYISLKSNINNLVNLKFIFAVLPKKQTQNSTPKRSKNSILSFSLAENNRKEIFTQHLKEIHIPIFNYYLKNLQRAINYFSFGITYPAKPEVFYYFSKPRSSI